MKFYAFTPVLITGLFASMLSLIWTPESNDPDPVFTGGIEGIVVLTPKSTPVQFGGGLYGRPSPAGNSAEGNDSVLVVLTGSNSGTADHVQMEFLNQKDQQFVPRLLPIQLDQTLRIQNSDPVYHNVFSLTSPHKFDVGRRPRGEHFDVQFEKPGVIDVFCDIHSNMHAIIYVLPQNTVQWTKIKSGESFAFSEVPEGTFELRVYALGYKESTQSITVQNGQTAGAGTITLNP